MSASAQVPEPFERIFDTLTFTDPKAEASAAVGTDMARYDFSNMIADRMLTDPFDALNALAAYTMSAVTLIAAELNDDEGESPEVALFSKLLAKLNEALNKAGRDLTNDDVCDRIDDYLQAVHLTRFPAQGAA